MTVERGEARSGFEGRRRRRRLRGRLGSLLVGAALLLAGCTSSGQKGNAFVFLTVDRFSLKGSAPVGSVNSSLSDRNTSTIVCATLRNNLKNPTVTAPTALDTVFIDTITVRLERLDGGPVPGPVSFGTGAIVPAGTVSMGVVSGNTATVPVILVPAQAKNQPPLRPAPALPLNAVARVTFKGRDGRGQRVETEGAVSVVFVATGSDIEVDCAAGGGTSSSPS